AGRYHEGIGPPARSAGVSPANQAGETPVFRDVAGSNTSWAPEEAGMSKPDDLGGIIHTYQKYDPVQFPIPPAPPPDLVAPAFEHLRYYGSMRRLSEEELARAVRIDPSQIRGLGPSLESLMALLRERKRKILETYETDQVQSE